MQYKAKEPRQCRGSRLIPYMRPLWPRRSRRRRRLRGAQPLRLTLSCHAQDLLDPVEHVRRIQAGALHLVGDLLGQHVRRIRSGRSCGDALDGAVVRVFQVDPAGAAFQLAPAVLHFHDGEGALAGLASDGVAHARALAVVQVADDDVHQEGSLGVAGRSCGSRCRAGADAQALVDFLSDGPVALVEILARAGLVCKPAVHGHVLLIHLADQVLVGLPEQLLDAVALADVDQQVDQCGIGLGRHGVGVLGVAGDLDGDGAVVVVSAGAAPGAICFIDGEADGAVLADDVVGGALPVGCGEVVAALLSRPLADDAMDRDGVDGVIAGAGLVLCDVGVCHQWAVAHGAALLCCKICVGVIVGLAVAGPLSFDAAAHVGRALVPCQHDVRGLFYGPGCSEHLEHGDVALQLLIHEVELHDQITDGRAGLSRVVEHGLLAAPVCPLCEAVACAVPDEVGILPGVHGGRILGVREAQALLVGVLEVLRIEPALGVQIAHEPRHAGGAHAFDDEIVPDGPLSCGPCRLHGLLSGRAGALAGGVAGVCQALADDVADDSGAGHDQASDLSRHLLSAAQGDDQHGDEGRHTEPELAARELADPVDLVHCFYSSLFLCSGRRSTSAMTFFAVPFPPSSR